MFGSCNPCKNLCCIPGCCWPSGTSPWFECHGVWLLDTETEVMCSWVCVREFLGVNFWEFLRMNFEVWHMSSFSKSKQPYVCTRTPNSLMSALISGSDNYNYENFFSWESNGCGWTSEPSSPAEQSFFLEKQMVVGEPPNPHLRHWQLFKHEFIGMNF